MANGDSSNSYSVMSTEKQGDLKYTQRRLYETEQI